MAKGRPKGSTKKVIETKKNVKVADRSEFNCKNCEGSGLLGDPTDARSKVCEVCRGSGKV